MSILLRLYWSLLLRSVRVGCGRVYYIWLHRLILGCLRRIRIILLRLCRLNLRLNYIIRIIYIILQNRTWRKSSLCLLLVLHRRILNCCGKLD